MLNNLPVVEIPDSMWEEIGESPRPYTRLIAALNINGVMFHVTAIQVKTLRDGYQKAATHQGTRELNNLYTLDEDVGAFATMRIKRRKYVVYLSPFGD